MICSEVISPLTLVRCYPIGVISMIDDGMVDHKVIAIPFKDPMWNTYDHIGELPPHIMDEMTHFLNVYKQLEYKTTTVLEVKKGISPKLLSSRISNNTTKNLTKRINKLCMIA